MKEQWQDETETPYQREGKNKTETSCLLERTSLLSSPLRNISLSPWLKRKVVFLKIQKIYHTKVSKQSANCQVYPIG